jgi:ribosomal protein S12 methylthiotransferase accessory factor
VIRCGSSLRAVPVAVTLERAAAWGAALGVTRVTEITHLDRIGIPVCVAIRPNARPGSLCVSAGKGLTPQEARVGAWMEAIEFALAEPRGVSHASNLHDPSSGIRNPNVHNPGVYPYVDVEIVTATARDVLNGQSRPDAILDFCPLLTTEISLDAPLPCVTAEDLIAGGTTLVPAEIVFLPSGPRAPSRHFTANSNGLASGNTLLEATVHGLAERVERDICAFHSLHDRSQPVLLASLPPPAAELASAIHAVGLRLIVRSLPNEFNLSCFAALILDMEAPTALLVNGGFGCHPHKSIALVRAICEAAQSRLSVIHGGRDDLTDQARRFRDWDEARLASYREWLQAGATAGEGEIAYQELVDRADEADDLPAAYQVLLKSLAGAGLQRVCRVVFTPPNGDLHIVRVIVPGLEEFNAFTPRVGRRLRDEVVARQECARTARSR